MIPKKFVYGWFGGAEKPRYINKCIDSWKRNAPEYEIVELNESTWDIEHSAYAQKAYEEKKFAFVWDEARIRWLRDNSGITLDADIEVLKPFDPFLFHGGFTSCESSGRWISAVIAAHEQSEWIKKIYDYYENNSFKYDPKTITNTVIIDTINKSMFEKNDGKIIYLNGGIAIYPREYFEAKNWSTGEIEITPRTYSIHHYKASWVLK